MNYKKLHEILPLEVIKYIGEFDNTSQERMNNVIQELNEYNHKIEEYWSEDEQAYYMSDLQISCRQKWDPQFANRPYPSLLNNTYSINKSLNDIKRKCNLSILLN